MMLATMADKKPSKKKPGPKPEGDAASGNRHKGVQLPVRVAPSFRALLEQIAKAERRPLAQMCRILLEDAVVARGYTLPDDSAEDAR